MLSFSDSTPVWNCRRVDDYRGFLGLVFSSESKASIELSINSQRHCTAEKSISPSMRKNLVDGVMSKVSVILRSCLLKDI